ncbi:two pore domain potassium channel family protein [Vibrio genomosp. F6]|uniref:potassium channel protein n=1 Tax=Vibrio genomosp. F6 TaxID=723172 RepID=UPI0010BD29C4|nr:potassium channel family protein [Vibrio genomosp. F6]TKF24132.1 two pore domain potassium channel family protein [Vibrio genomosp. F6]
MMIWLQFKRWAHANLFELNGRNLLIAFVVYLGVSWCLLRVTGESALTASFTDFIYYLAVTASTVGYGDMSPETNAGKWAVMLFVIPGGLTLFAALLGQFASVGIEYWRAGLLGKRKMNVENHILLLGWNGQRTIHLIRMLQHEETGRRPIVLCSRSDIENPLPGEIGFVKVTSYTDSQEMENAQIAEASCILIDNPEDDITLSAALYCSNINPTAHLLVYFKDEALSRLLHQHCPNSECIPAIDTEMLAKAAVDPGSSALHQELLSSTRGMTQYSTIFPMDKDETLIEPIFHMFKSEHQATLIAIDAGEGIELNPELKTVVKPGTKIFYIADERLEHFDWNKLN